MTYASPSMHRGARIYARVGVETTALSATPHRLISMLFDGLDTEIAKARHYMTENQVAAKGAAISKAISIIESGLKAGLDPVAGGADGAQLVEHLSELYDGLVVRLVKANLRNDPLLLDQVAQLLEPVSSAWRELALRVPVAPEAAYAVAA